MSLEMYSQSELSVVRDKEMPEVEYERGEVSCGNKLAFTALCATCPLVALFGGCPKEIREDVAYGPKETSTEPTSENLYINTNDSFDLLVKPVKDDSFEVLSAVLEASTINKQEVKVQSTIQREQPKTDNINTALNERPTVEIPIDIKKEPVEIRRSYRDLLFDDSVAIVLAPQFKLRKRLAKKTVELAKEDIVETIYDEPVPGINKIKTVPSIPQVTIIEACKVGPVELAVAKKIDTPTIPVYKEVLLPIQLIEQIKIEPIDVIEEPVKYVAIAPRVPEVPIVEVPSIQRMDVENSEKDKSLGEESIVETPEIILEVAEFEQMLVEESSEIYEPEFFSSADPLDELDTISQYVAETPKKEAINTIVSLPSVKDYEDTPEVLNDSVKISSSKQPWTIITLFGFIALLKLVTKNISAEM